MILHRLGFVSSSVGASLVPIEKDCGMKRPHLSQLKGLNKAKLSSDGAGRLKGARLSERSRLGDKPIQALSKLGRIRDLI